MTTKKLIAITVVGFILIFGGIAVCVKTVADAFIDNGGVTIAEPCNYKNQTFSVMTKQGVNIRAYVKIIAYDEYSMANLSMMINKEYVHSEDLKSLRIRDITGENSDPRGIANIIKSLIDKCVQDSEFNVSAELYRVDSCYVEDDDGNLYKMNYDLRKYE